MKNKEFRFDERRDLIAYVESQIIEDEHIGRTIYKRARYNYFIKSMSDSKSYNEIIKFIDTHSNLGLTELELSEFIKSTIRSAKKYNLKSVDHIYITKSELEFIQGLDDIKLEKIAFVILCLAKYHNAVSDEVDDCIYFKLSDIKKMARINMNRVDFEYFYNNLYDKGALVENNIATSTIQILKFVCHDDNDEIIFELSEVDYLELAYLYLYIKNGQKGFVRCQQCNRLIKERRQNLDCKAKNTKKYCEECANERHLESKRVSEQKRRGLIRGQN